MISSSGNYIVVYFSCDRKLALRIIKDKEHIKLTRDSSGWFGRGFYFWDDPLRALRDAIDRANNGEIQDPAVIAVVIDPGNCFNLFHPVSLTVRPEEYLLVKKFLRKLCSGKGRKKQGGMPFDAVYCPVQDDISSNDRTMRPPGQIYLPDAYQIKGCYFMQPWQLFNPWLGQTGYL